MVCGVLSKIRGIWLYIDHVMRKGWTRWRLEREATKSGHRQRKSISYTPKIWYGGFLNGGTQIWVVYDGKSNGHAWICFLSNFQDSLQIPSIGFPIGKKTNHLLQIQAVCVWFEILQRKPKSSVHSSVAGSLENGFHLQQEMVISQPSRNWIPKPS